LSYYSNESPISTYPNHALSVVPPFQSSSAGVLSSDTRFTSTTPIYEGSNQRKLNRTPPQAPHLQIVPESSSEPDDGVDEDDSELYTWEPMQSPNTPPQSASSKRPSHRKCHPGNEQLLKHTKKAHTVVEKNYRERLNDKIADLAVFLFETSSDPRTKPSKSLVMTRAMERLKQLEARNKFLENEVVDLRQRIAILDHVVSIKKDSGSTAVNALS